MKSNFCETFEQISRGISAGSGNRPRISSGQAPPGDVQKSHEADVGDELTAESETEPKDLTEVDVTLDRR